MSQIHGHESAVMLSTDSVLSELSTISSPSSTQSFHTATGASPSNAGDGTTTLSSPEPVSTTYREAKQLPDELKEHVKIFLEERLCEHHAKQIYFAS